MSRLEFPRHGESTNESLTDQPGRTSRRTTNCMLRDPVDGRNRGAQRPGASEYSAGALAAAPVARIESVAQDRPGITYAHVGTPAETWSQATSTRIDTVGIATDRQGNVWVIDGKAGLAQINPQGRRVLKIELPVVDTAQEVRALCVSGFNTIFAGVSAGGDVNDAQLWAFRLRTTPDSREEAELLWTKEVDGATSFGFTEQLRLGPDGSLYALQNNPDTAESWVVVYGSPQSAVPTYVRRMLQAYPAHDMVVKAGGGVVTCSPPNPNRGRDQNGVFAEGKSIELWNPYTDLEQADARIFCDLDPMKFAEDNPDADAGDPVGLLRDRSGRGRHAYGEGTGGVYGTTDPLFQPKSLAGRPSVFFDGAGMGFRSGANSTTLRNFLEQQQTWFPSAYDTMMAFVSVLRVPYGTQRYQLFGRIREGQAAGHALNTYFFANAGKNLAYPPSLSAGRIHAHLPIDDIALGPLNDQVAPGEFDNEYDLAIVTWVCPGTEQNDTYDAGFAQRGHWRINGVPIEVWDGVTASLATTLYNTVLPMMMGPVTAGAPSVVDWTGELFRLFVLRDYKSSTHPARGCIHINAVPLAGDSITIDDGVNPPISYQWGVGVDTEVLQHINPIPGTAQACATALIAKINTPTLPGVLTNITAAASTTHPTAGQELFKVLLENSTIGLRGNKPFSAVVGAWFDSDKTWGMTTARVVECPLYPDVAYDPAAAATEIERLEGWLAWLVGSSSKLPGPSAPFPHAYSSENGPPVGKGREAALKILHPGSVVLKYSPAGELKWALTDEDLDPVTGANELGGLGLGLALDSDGHLFSVGPHKGSDETSVRRIMDFGDTFSVDPADGAWTSGLSDGATVAANQELEWQYPRLAVDTFDNLYVPRSTPTTTNAGATRDRAGLTVFDQVGAAGVGVLVYEVTLADEQRGRAVAIDPKLAVFGDDPVSRAEHVYLATDNQGGRAPAGSIRFHAVPTLPPTGQYITIDDGVAGHTPRIYEFHVGGGTTIPGAIGINIAAAGTPDAVALALDGFIAGQHPTFSAIDSFRTGSLIRLQHDLAGTQYNIAIENGLAVPGNATVYGMTGGSDEADTGTVHKIRAVAGVGANVAQRVRHTIAVVDGGVYRFTRSGSGLATDGAAVISATARYVSSAAGLGEIFLSDGTGRVPLVWRPPTAANPNGIVVPLEPDTAGAPEPRCNLLTFWGGRLVIARGNAWFMSERDNPYGWDFFPDSPTPASAVLGAFAEVSAGLAPDLITGLAPLDDDTLGILCDSSVFVLRGDPRANGTIHQVLKKDGAAFGNAWVRDPEGFFYWKGYNGGIYVAGPGFAAPKRITRDRLERQMQDIDHGAYRVSLTWDFRHERLLVALIPWGTAPVFTETVRGWSWDKKSDGWWPFEYSRVEAQPTCYYELESADDPQDRTVLLGGSDGRIRAVDELAKNDGVFSTVTAKISSDVLLGPYRADDPAYEVLFSNLSAILTRNSDTLSYRVYAGDDPEDLGNPVAQGTFAQGRNEIHPARAAGGTLWLELYNAAEDERWALESLSADLERGGLALA